MQMNVMVQLKKQLNSVKTITGGKISLHNSKTCNVWKISDVAGFYLYILCCDSLPEQFHNQFSTDAGQFLVLIIEDKYLISGAQSLIENTIEEVAKKENIQLTGLQQMASGYVTEQKISPSNMTD